MTLCLPLYPPPLPQEVNLSYQDLGDPYQARNFHRCLKRLVRCRHLQLVDNSLTDLSGITLPKSAPTHSPVAVYRTISAPLTVDNTCNLNLQLNSS